VKKALVIGYMWPYHPKGGGRIPKLVRYLPEFGWQPVVLTAPLSEKPDLGCEIIETPCRDVLSFYKSLYKSLFRVKSKEGIRNQISQRFGVAAKGSAKKKFMDFIFTRFDEIVGYPDFERGWKPFAIKAGSELLENKNIELIMSVSPPVTSHLIARELKLRHKIPWVADLCHLWSQNNGYPYSPLRKLIDRRLELKTLSSADALVTVCEPLTVKLGTLHKGKPIYSITHGFDPSDLNIPPAKLSEKFTITYTGSLHPALREPSRLFKALQNLITKRVMNPDDIEVRFYGPKENWLDIEIEKYGLSGFVKQYGGVPLEVSLEKQRESQVLLFLMWQDSQEAGVITSKIFEYLATMRPILAVGEHNDVVNELLTETGAGIWAPLAEDVERALERMYQEYKLKKEIVWHKEVSVINKYSRRELVRKFFQIFESLTQQDSKIVTASSD